MLALSPSGRAPVFSPTGSMQSGMGSARASRAVVGALANQNNTHGWFTI
jgi:hypothetical protein